MIYLLSERAFEGTSKTLSRGLEAWENQNLDFGFGYWVTDRFLGKLQEQEVDLEILASREPLPVFVDAPDSKVQEQQDSISAICISRADGISSGSASLSRWASSARSSAPASGSGCRG